MSVYGTEIGQYIDPGMIPEQNYGELEAWRPSFNGAISPAGLITLPDGRVAIVDSEGIIIGYK